MKNNYFKGIYYKFKTKDGLTFALIDGDMANGKTVQFITPTHSYLISNPYEVNIANDEIKLNITQDNLSLRGRINLINKHPLKKDVMGILRHLPLECKHNIYSMYGDTIGYIYLNDEFHTLNDGVSYIEGDEGSNFPKDYIWLNALNKDYGITLAIASIQLNKKVNFKGAFFIYKDSQLEINFSTLNGLKIVEINGSTITLKKGKYLIRVEVPTLVGKELLAPKNGVMSYSIHEAVDTTVSIAVKFKHKTLVKKENIKASLERVNL